MKTHVERMQRVLVCLGVACLALVVLGPLSAQEPKEKVPSDKEKIQGKWKLISFEADGEKETEQVGMIWVFDRDKLVMGDEGDFSYRLEPSKTPKQIDATGKPEEGFPAPGMVGIYKLEGDTLTLCWRTTRAKELLKGGASDELKVRPSVFQSVLYYHQFLFVLERVKAKK